MASAVSYSSHHMASFHLDTVNFIQPDYNHHNCSEWVIPLVITLAMLIAATFFLVVVIRIIWPRRPVAVAPPQPEEELVHQVSMDKFLNDMEREKPIRFTDQQLRVATNNYPYLLGSGGFGTVYKGTLNNRTIVAVKVLRGSPDKRIDEQFMAEVGTIGKVHHFNLVRLYGFCVESHLRALVYEYMPNGALDKYLFHETTTLSFEKLHDIAVGTARGIAYLHEECQQRIIHYDIKPGNILLDRNFSPKVANFGLAKLCNRDKSHITMTGVRETPGYAAPELWIPFPVTHKCDFYSFGMLLFEIIGRRRNHNMNLPESQEWFPMWAWKRFDTKEVKDLLTTCGIEDQNRVIPERTIKVALSCVQYKPESRPIMSVVVKILEGSIEVPKPLNPFMHLVDWISPTDLVQLLQINTDTTSSDSSVHLLATTAGTKSEIELASA